MTPQQRSLPTQIELSQAIRDHQSWLTDPNRGRRLEWTNVDLVGLTLSGDLTKATFNNCHFTSATFESVKGSSLSFHTCTFERALFNTCQFGPQGIRISLCSFPNARFILTRFIGASITACGFNGAQFQNSSFSRSALSECSFIDANFENFSFAASLVKSSTFSGAKFGQGCSILKSDFFVNDLPGLDFAGFRSLEGSSLRNCSMPDALLKQITLGQLNGNGLKLKELTGCNLSSCNAEGTVFNDCAVQNCDFTGGNLAKSSLDGDIGASVFRSANLSGASFGVGFTVERVSFEHANLRDIESSAMNSARANFRYADLTRADLSFADLRGASFHHAILTDAKLGGADLDGAIWQGGQICQPGSMGQCNLTD